MRTTNKTTNFIMICVVTTEDNCDNRTGHLHIYTLTMTITFLQCKKLCAKMQKVCVESVLLLTCQWQVWFICLVIWIFTKLVPTDDENTMTFSNCKKPQTWRSSNHKYWLKVISKNFLSFNPNAAGWGASVFWGMSFDVLSDPNWLTIPIYLYIIYSCSFWVCWHCYHIR